MNLRLIFSIAVVISCVSCGNSPPFSQVVLSPDINHILVEVDYMENMAPFTNTSTNEPLWSFLENNISALFQDTKSLTVPKSLNAMQEIPARNQNYMLDDILSLADEYRDQKETDGPTASLYIIFLDGYLKHEGQIKNSVIGISVSGTSIIAVFKPVIYSRAFPLPAVKFFIEQSVLIHEAGHAFGLVNNGLALTSDHHDQEHGAHCTNSSCVMYYLNEGVSDLIEFIRDGFSLQEVIFKDECLQDAHAALGSI
ncbi:MAG: hypothetical protein KDD48_07540 [Bdellovibrionales bacterium]|nr:hypothetical protein [Bdellovibrionales bacterium]